VSASCIADIVSRGGVLFHRICVEEVVAGGNSANRGTELIQRRLLLGLERARTHLAVAIASESKITPPEGWRNYRETEDRMRRCLKVLRARNESRHADPDPWRSALEMLDSLPGPLGGRSPQYEAQRLCRCLSEVLGILEASGVERGDKHR
jgi:hypothetical protein